MDRDRRRRSDLLLRSPRADHKFAIRILSEALSARERNPPKISGWTEGSDSLRVSIDLLKRSGTQKLKCRTCDGTGRNIKGIVSGGDQEKCPHCKGEGISGVMNRDKTATTMRQMIGGSLRYFKYSMDPKRCLDEMIDQFEITMQDARRIGALSGESHSILYQYLFRVWRERAK